MNKFLVWFFVGLIVASIGTYLIIRFNSAEAERRHRQEWSGMYQESKCVVSKYGVDTLVDAAGRTEFSTEGKYCEIPVSRQGGDSVTGPSNVLIEKGMQVKICDEEVVCKQKMAIP
jgi:hypothetical protein